MEQIMEYVKPELLAVAVVLYFIGTAIKKIQLMPNKYIPVTLGFLGIILAGIWVVGTCPLTSPQQIALAVFTAIVQGILVAGLSTYIHQIIKQANKKE